MARNNKIMMEFCTFLFTQLFSNYRVDDELYESFGGNLVDGLPRAVSVYKVIRVQRQASLDRQNLGPKRNFSIKFLRFL